MVARLAGRTIFNFSTVLSAPSLVAPGRWAGQGRAGVGAGGAPLASWPDGHGGHRRGVGFVVARSDPVDRARLAYIRTGAVRAQEVYANIISAGRVGQDGRP